MPRSSARLPRLRVDGYVRVSQVRGRHGERFISPTVQRESIEAWADARGAVVLSIFEELDESGLRSDRPLLEAAVRRAEEGVSDGIVVARLDRFGRSLLHGLQTIERIRSAGATFISVQDGFDVTTDTGKLILRLLLSFAEWDVDRMRSSFAIARLKAVDRGVHLGAYAPWGYRRNNAGRLRPDPRTGTMVTELFRMRAAGRPLAEIARWVQAQGVLTGSGNSTWTASSVHSITRNPVYLGEVRCNEHVRAGAHAPLTDPVTWQAAQHRVALRDSFTGGEGRLLSGLVRCSACCMTMAFRRTPTASVYGCRGKSSKGRCPARGLIRAELLEAYVESIVFELLRRRRRLGVAAEHQATEALAAADAALVRYRDNEAIARVLGEDRFVAGLAVRTDRVRTARLKLATIRESAAMHTLPRAGEIEANWSTMSVRQRRDIIRSVIDCVFIARGTRAQGAPERVWLCPVGTAPRFPHTRNGYRLRNGPRPFSPTRSTVRPKTAYRLFRWPHKRIDRELRHFTRGRATWPTEAEFCDADRRTLYWQIRLGAGERTWAHHLHLTIFRYGVLEEPWTDDRTRAALRLYLSDHPIRPSPHQLAINDLFSLRTGMARTGGQAKWVQELGLPDAWA